MRITLFYTYVTLANSSLLTWRGHSSILAMWTHDVIISRSIHKNKIDRLHLVQPRTSVIFAAMKGSSLNYTIDFL